MEPGNEVNLLLSSPAINCYSPKQSESFIQLDQCANCHRQEKSQIIVRLGVRVTRESLDYAQGVHAFKSYLHSKKKLFNLTKILVTVVAN